MQVSMNGKNDVVSIGNHLGICAIRRMVGPYFALKTPWLLTDVHDTSSDGNPLGLLI